MEAPLKFIRSLFRTVSVAVSAGIFVIGILFLGFLINIFRGLPDVATLKNYQHSHATEVFSDEGKKIGEFTTERRYPVRFDQVPKHVVESFISAEDSNFYEHKGIDFSGIARAVISNVVKGRYAQGASTITQQVARSILLETRKKEITRKIREMILAWRMERELSKNEILHLYLSEIYLGHGAFGIGAAAQNYFRKKVEDLTLAEGAMLAGLPQRPNDWDPFHKPYACKQRQQYVLKRMVEEGYLAEAQAREALATPLKLYKVEELNPKAAPYFTEYVRLYLMNKYGSENVLSQGFKVYTTVRYDFQKIAEKALDRGLREVDKRMGWRGRVNHLDTNEKMMSFLITAHDEVLDRLSPLRILPATIEPGTRKLSYDLSAYQDKNSPYFGATPILVGQYHSALITEVNEAKQFAIGRIGQTSVTISFASMEWIQVNNQPLKKIGQILQSGDVVHVRIDKTDKRTNVAEASLEQEPEVQGAILSYDIRNGYVRTMVGGTDFQKSQFNRALHAKRQVGSTFKPIIYAAAIDKGYSPSSIVTDAPLVFKYDGGLDADNQGEDWRPSNYSGKFQGDITLRQALIRSMNIPTVKLLNEIGIDHAIQYARTLGITAVLPRELTIALGSWSSSLEELMRAYAIFPRLGQPIKLIYIKKVVDASGQVLEELPTAPVENVEQGQMKMQLGLSHPAGDVKEGGEINEGGVISPQTAYVMTDMLKAVIRDREGTGRAASGVPGATAGKTGTSNDHRDAWFIGYSPQVMTGVWVGFDKEKPLDIGETGGRAAAPIWSEYMSNILVEYPRNADFIVPDDITIAYVERSTGRLATSQSEDRVRVAFKGGTVPTLAGDNIPRIGEPGTHRASVPAGEQVRPLAETKESPPKAGETSDFLREGYQD